MDPSTCTLTRGTQDHRTEICGTHRTSQPLGPQLCSPHVIKQYISRGPMHQGPGQQSSCTCFMHLLCEERSSRLRWRPRGTMGETCRPWSLLWQPSYGDVRPPSAASPPHHVHHTIVHIITTTPHHTTSPSSNKQYNECTLSSQQPSHQSQLKLEGPLFIQSCEYTYPASRPGARDQPLHTPH